MNEESMNIVLLSGGSGTRLWPLSNEVRSKQFVKLIKSENGLYESMIQRVYRQIKRVDPTADVVVATSKSQESIINRQLNNQAKTCIEPFRRDTFPAISLASAYLVDVLKKSPNEPVVFCPVDPYVDDSFFDKVKELYDHVLAGNSNLTLIGIGPTCPSEKYGYIIPKSSESISRVLEFKEKPSLDKAAEYLKLGALWNGGVFGFKIKYILDKADILFGMHTYKQLFDNYEKLTKVSFDYAVVENEKNIDVIRYNGLWLDIGTWDSLTEVMDENVVGNGTIDESCQNVHIINELNLPIIALGLKDVVVAASPDGILVSNKKRSDALKKFAKNITLRPMFEERFWGSYKILDYNINKDNQNSLTKHLIINPNNFISYQKHQRRSELWTVVEGTGIAVINGKAKKVSRGDFICIKPNDFHAIKAVEELHIIEVQIGEELIEEDIERFDLDWETVSIK